MGCGMFCTDGEVVFIHSKHVNKIGSSTLILVVTCGLLKDYLGGVIDSVNVELASSDSKNECTRTKHTFPPFQRLALGQWPL